jgi:chaperonin GroES
MAIKPVGDRVLVQPDEWKNETDGGIILPDKSEKKPTFGTVIEVSDIYAESATLRVGTRIFFRRHRGTEVKNDGKKFLILDVEEIMAVIE